MAAEERVFPTGCPERGSLRTCTGAGTSLEREQREPCGQRRREPFRKHPGHQWQQGPSPEAPSLAQGTGKEPVWLEQSGQRRLVGTEITDDVSGVTMWYLLVTVRGSFPFYSE